MIASNLKDIDNGSVKIFDDISVLSTSYIYGYIATGKSNIIKILNYLFHTITDSLNSKPIGNLFPFLLNTSGKQKPTELEIDLLHNHIIYTYRLVLVNKDITEESLYIKKQRKTLMYKRVGTEIHGQDSFLQKFKNIRQFLNNKVTVASLAKKFQISEVNEFILAVKQNKIVYTSVPASIDTAKYTLSDEKNISKRIVLKYFKKLLVDINDYTVEYVSRNKFVKNDEFNNPTYKTIEEPIIKISKPIYDEKRNLVENKFVPLAFESDGVKKIVNLAGIVQKALEKGYTLIIDEFGEKLHPIVIMNIIKLFNERRYNRTGAQLIITSHHLSLLVENIRRDQVWITDKNDFGESSLTRLSSLGERISPKVLEKLLNIHKSNPYNLNKGYNQQH
jgi:hypothetical protein